MPLHDISAGATVTRKRQPSVYPGVLGESYWPDASTTVVIFQFAIPDDYVAGDLAFKVFRRGAATNTAFMERDSYRFRDASAFSTIESGTNMNFTPGNTNSQIVTITIATANFQAGDIVRVDLRRIGGHASDTMTANVFMDGCWVEYTGRA